MQDGSQYLWPVSLLCGEGYIHHISDGEPSHGALSEGDDLVDAFHHGVQLAVRLQRELAADLKTRGDRGEARALSPLVAFIPSYGRN